MKKVPHHEGGEGITSYNNTHHAAFAVVDDFLHGVLQFGLALFSDGSQLASDTILHQLFYGLSKDVCFPDAFTALSAQWIYRKY